MNDSDLIYEGAMQDEKCGKNLSAFISFTFLHLASFFKIRFLLFIHSPLGIISSSCIGYTGI